MRVTCVAIRRSVLRVVKMYFRDAGTGVLVCVIRQLFREQCTLILAILFVVLFSPASTTAQNWVWSTETADISGRSMSIVADADGNVHMSYGGNEGLKYGFRPAGEKGHWFTMPLKGNVSYTDLTVDRQGNPHICATYLSLPLRYARYDGKEWNIQEIAPEDTTSVQAACGVVISADGTPHLSWYRYAYDNSDYKHIKYAVLKDGSWLMRTLDFDVQSGKWHSMVLDPQGNPCIKK